MANKYIDGSGVSRLWKKLQDSLVTINNKLKQKQDTIVDLTSIRDGAAKGATALQEVPIAENNSDSRLGLSRYYGAGWGIFCDATGLVMLSTASNAQVDNKKSDFALKPKNIDRAIRAGLVANAEITDADKPQICQTIGAEYGNYSYDEVDTGKTWVDGKKIYRTCINFGNLPNNGRASKRVTLSDIYGMIISINGIAFDGSYMFPLPLVSKSAPILVYGTAVNATAFNILIETTSDRSSLVGYVIVEYTR